MSDLIQVTVIQKGEKQTCDCCQKRNMKKLYEISSELLEYRINFGSTCIEKHFDVSMTGNPFAALSRLKTKLNNMRFSEVEEIIYHASLKEVDS